MSKRVTIFKKETNKLKKAIKKVDFEHNGKIKSFDGLSMILLKLNIIKLRSQEYYDFCSRSEKMRLEHNELIKKLRCIKRLQWHRGDNNYWIQLPKHLQEKLDAKRVRKIKAKARYLGIPYEQSI